MFRIITVNELLEMLDNYNHKELHVHHTWSPSHKDFNGTNGLQLQEGMKNYHLSLGWADIGQHVTLLPDGLFVTGRDFGRDPASITGMNTGAFAVETLGNFDIGNDVLQGEQKSSLLKLAKYFDDKGKYIRFHRENSPKTCPGTSIDKDIFLSEMRAFGNEPTLIIKYQAHVQNIGWQDWVQDGVLSGSEGRSLRLEALAMTINKGDIEFSGHVQNLGWQNNRRSGEVIGTVGRELRLEAIKMRLIDLPGHSIQYQTHVEGIGWMDWCFDDEISGTEEKGLRIEAIRIRIIKK